MRLPRDSNPAHESDEGDDGDDEPPLTSLGKFHLLERIGQGGMGEVYLALLRGPTGFDKLVVVKLLREDFAAYRDSREMFFDEGRLAARLNHPNVVQANEVGVEAGRHYLVMEYLEGQSLDQLLERVVEVGASVPTALWLRVALDALAGLDYAHELCNYDGTPLDVVHRDLSPHNIFLTYEGQVKLLDFGIAKAATQSAKTQAGTVKGKPAYMAPEQLLGHAVDRRADLFVFGIVLWELFTRHRLFTDSVSDCLRRHRNPPPRVSSLVPGFDPALDAVIARALEPDPAARFQTARELRDALAAAATEAGPVAPVDAVGGLMNDLFREQHEERRGMVKRYVSERIHHSAAPSPGAVASATPGMVASATPGAAPPPAHSPSGAPSHHNRAPNQVGRAKPTWPRWAMPLAALTLTAASTAWWSSAGHLGVQASGPSRASLVAVATAIGPSAAGPSDHTPLDVAALSMAKEAIDPAVGAAPELGPLRPASEAPHAPSASPVQCPGHNAAGRAKPRAPTASPSFEPAPPARGGAASSKRTFRTDL